MAPAYQRIAEDLRAAILDGSLVPGTQLPSRAELAARYGVSDQVPARAVNALRAEGLVVTRPGAGAFVAARRPVRRFTRGHYGRPGQGSPFAAQEHAAGRAGTWDARSQTETADVAIADRLAIEPGDTVMRTQYVFRADGAPVMLSTSYEPLAITGVPDEEGRMRILLPEEGEFAGAGVVDRMAAIGIRVTRSREVISDRAARAEEVEALGGIASGHVLHIVRTYLDDQGRPVETADIVLPGDRSEVESWYEIPQ